MTGLSGQSRSQPHSWISIMAAAKALVEPARSTRRARIAHRIVVMPQRRGRPSIASAKASRSAAAGSAFASARRSG